MKTLFSILTLFVLTSCGSFPEDNTPAPIDYGLWNLELHYDGQRDVGLMGTTFRESDLDKELTIPLWHKGEYSIRSKRCLFSRQGTYDVNRYGEVSFSLRELTEMMPKVEFACIFNVLVFVEGLDKGFQGQFTLSEIGEFEPVRAEIGNKQYSGVGWYQVRETVSLNMEFNFVGLTKSNRKGLMFFEGCGKKGEKRFQGDFTVPLSFFTQGGSPQKCVYEVGFLYDDGGKGIFTLNLKVFDQKVIGLPDPEVKFRNGILRIRSPYPVIYTAVGKNFKRGRYEFEKVGDKTVYIRMLTANGRFKMLGIKQGEVVWRSSSKF